MRYRAVVLLLGVLISVAFIGPARADSDEQPSATTVPAGAVSIGNGYAFTSATITPLAGGPARTFDAYHAAVFVQSWLGEAFFGTPEISNPPPDAPVSRIDVTGSWGVQSGYMVVYYATDGTKPWISFPDGQTPTPAPADNAPPPGTWFVGTPQVIQAFNGTATLVPTAGVADPQNNGTGSPAKKSDSSKVWVIVLVVALVALAAAVFLLRRRRSSVAA